MVFEEIIYVYCKKHNEAKQYPLEKNKKIINCKEGGILYCVGLRAFVVFGTFLSLAWNLQSRRRV
jgi:hypothetical protein